MAQYAAQIAAGRTLADLNFTDEPPIDGYFVKEAVLPFRKFPGVDAQLGPEMKSTGEVMGHDRTFGHAFAKAQSAAGMELPTEGVVVIGVNNLDRVAAGRIARDLHQMGFTIKATEGNAEYLQQIGLPAIRINKVSEGSPHIVDAIRAGEVQLVINTPLGGQAHADGIALRSAAHQYGVPIVTTLSAAAASVQGIRALRQDSPRLRSLQAHYAATARGGK